MDPFAFPDEEQNRVRKSAVSLALLGAIGTQCMYSPQTELQNQYNATQERTGAGLGYGDDVVLSLLKR